MARTSSSSNASTGHIPKPFSLNLYFFQSFNPNRTTQLDLNLGDPIDNPNNGGYSLMGYIKDIPTLKGYNYEEWKRELDLAFILGEVDWVLTTPCPIEPADLVRGEKESDAEWQKRERDNAPLIMSYDIEHVKWSLANKNCLAAVKDTIEPTILGSIPEYDTVSKYLESIKSQFTGSSKFYATQLIKQLVTERYHGGGVKDHILRMSDMASKLKPMDLGISDAFLVHLVMTSLPKNFDNFVVNYKISPEKWNLEELISNCVQEEERIKETNGASNNLVKDNKEKSHWGSSVVREIDLEERRVSVPAPSTQEPFFSLPADVVPPMHDVAVPTHVVISPVATMNESEEPILQDSTEIIATLEEELQQPQTDNVPEQEAPRRSEIDRRSAIHDDYHVHNIEESHMEDDPTSYEEAMRSARSSEWLEAMKDEIKLMKLNNVWDLEEIPKEAKTVGCKWVYKTKYDSRGHMEKFKARLVAKGFTQREGIDYNETFSLVSCKDSLRITMALVAHYDLELHQMDVKRHF
uniref:Retroelement n=2 Tax=Oryza sativa subsp. japonica TaxID=39947 RepID=A0A5S6R891_ORYSJ|nr:Putative retroelement [Oryza sativa Japonica Group]AAN04198.1 Putative retroelement [Oryza sativa Japonica Group]AAP52319.1 retrotransposon protein, putative, Ty1-copia subclass [Oryza sativa Japonica Group]